MVKKRTKFMALATALAVLTGSLGAMLPTGTSYAQEGYGTVTASIEGDTVTIGNSAIKRTFSKTGNKLTTTKIENLLGDTEFIPGTNSEEFVLETVGGASDLNEPAEGDLTSVKTDSWSIDGSSNSTQEGGGYDALIDGNPETHYHSNYGQGTGTNGTLPITLTIDRGEGSDSTSFQTLGYRPRNDGANANGNIKNFELYVGDSSGDDLFTQANLKKTGTFYYNGIYATAGNPEYIYVSFDEAQTGRYVGLKVLTSAGSQANKFAAGTELNLYKEKWDSFTVTEKHTIKASALTLANVTESDTEAVINDKEKTGKMLTFTFKPVTIGSGEAEITQKVVMYDGDHFMRKFLEIKLADQDARISYIDGEHLVTTAGTDKTWTIPTNAGGVVAMDVHKANLGQPIYINGMFMGSEFPAADNQIVSNLGRLRYWTGKNFKDFTRDNQLTQDGKYVSWQTVVGASHSDGTDQNVIQSDFYDYIYSIATPSEFRIQYNSWYDNMMRITDENIFAAFAGVDKNLSKTGVRPLDSYVVDDGWNIYRKAAGELNDRDGIDRNGATDVNNTGFWAFNSKFPDELTPSSELVQNFGSNFGVWIGPRGGYNYHGDIATVIQNAGNGSKAGGSIDVADDRYVKKFEEMVIDWMERWQVNYWKWDGFADGSQYGAFSSGEGVVGYSETNKHMYGGPNGFYHSTDLWEKWITLMKNVREAEERLGINRLWISLTCYTNPSPWYLQWANSVWLQCVADRGERWNATLNNKMDNMLTYRDGAYYDFIKRHQFQFPLANVYNHDPIYGKEGTDISANSMDGEQFRNYMFMQGTRGTAFWELYYSDSIFDEEKYLINADFLEWAEGNFSMLRNAKMIGGTPSSSATLTGGVSTSAANDTQEAYGFSCFDGASGIISMRNPDDADKQLRFTLNDAIGVTEEGTYHVTVEHSYVASGEVAALPAETFEKDETVTITLKPGETQIWKLTQTPDEEAPILDKIYVKSENVIQVRSSERLFADDIQFTVKVNDAEVEATVEKIADLRSFNLTLATALNDGDKVEVETTGATDRSKNDLNSVINTTYYINNIIAEADRVTGSNVVISPSTRSMLGDNGFAVTAKVETDDKNKVLVKQGDDYALGIDGEGHPYFTYNGSKATADVVLSSEAETILTGVVENNGLIKIYVDGEVKNADYKPENKAYFVTEDDIIANGVNGILSDVKVYSQSLGYDEVPSTALAELVTKVESEKDLYTTESWTAASMDQKLTDAKAAIASEEKAQMDSQYDILYAAYKTLVPTVKKHLALNKDVEAAWLDTSETETVVNSGSPLSKAVDGVSNNTNSYGIFGKDGKDKPSYITIDLGETCLIEEVKLYRYWQDSRTYKNTALVVSNDEDFATKEVLYYSGTSDVMSLGQSPTEAVYQESAEGKVLYQGKAKEARYVRLYAQGVQNGGQENHIVELQVLGMPKSHNPYDLTALEALIAQAQAEEEKTAVYTQESLEALTQAREAAEAVVEAVSAGTQEDKSMGYILTAQDNLSQALAGLQQIGGELVLADYRAVDAAIEKANALTPSDYKDFSAVEAAIEAVVRDLADTEQERVNAMADAIEAAIAQLEKVEEAPDLSAYKTELSNLIKQGEDAAASEKYTDASVKAVTTQVASAKNILNNAATTEAQFKSAIAALESVLAKLVEKDTTDNPTEQPDLSAYKTKLNSLIKQGEEAAASKKYTDASVKAVTTQVAGAKKVLNNAATTEAQFKSAISALESALAKLEKKVVEKPWLFTDVEQNGTWKHQSVKYVYNNDIMGAVGGSTQFQPDRPLSRSMFATVLYRMAGSPKVAYTAKFSDVPAGKWYSDAIIWAYGNKIVSGMGDGTYGIDINITREQIAKMLYEYARVCKYDVSAKKDLSSFTDMKSVSKWAVDYMKWATAVEMITGKPNDAAKTSFRMDPQGEATRAECAAMLMRFQAKYGK